MELFLDDGMQFGLGVFETIAVEAGEPVLLEWHLERLYDSMNALGIPERDMKAAICDYLETAKQDRTLAHHALKVIVTKENVIFTLRENSYKPSMYDTGFCADISKVYRNETSKLIYHKTMNYGDCILEKRDASAKGFQERIFLNSKGEISEGCVSNIFFVCGDKLLTPAKSCGLLPGVMRRFVMNACTSGGLTLEECVIRPEDLPKMQECFVTNSLMGIMPVNRLGEQEFRSRTYTHKLMDAYGAFLKDSLQ